MTPLVSLATTISAFATIISQVFVVIFLFLIFQEKKSALFIFVKRYALTFAFLVALAATLGSLFFSEIAGYLPCSLCWYQRIFMFPLALILGIAVWRGDRRIIPYAIIISWIGMCIAAYHHYVQLGGSPLIPCSAAAESVSCAQRFVFEFGYITIPLMTLTAFALILTILYIGKEK